MIERNVLREEDIFREYEPECEENRTEVLLEISDDAYEILCERAGIPYEDRTEYFNNDRIPDIYAIYADGEMGCMIETDRGDYPCKLFDIEKDIIDREFKREYGLSMGEMAEEVMAEEEREVYATVMNDEVVVSTNDGSQVRKEDEITIEKKAGVDLAPKNGTGYQTTEQERERDE